MCTMPTCFNARLWALLLGALLVAGGSVAQQRIEWPRTFSGQPDFDFVREDVVKERAEKAAEGEDVLARPMTWNDVLDAQKVDPFEPRYPKDMLQKKTGFPGIDLTAAGTDDVDETIDAAPIKLASFAVTTTVDVTEFRTFLENIISKGMRMAPPHFEELNMASELKRVVVQTISISPQKYAMINGRRYMEGDMLQLPVYMPVRIEDILLMVDRNMPNPEQLGVETQKTYEKIRTDVVADFTANRKKRPNAYKAKHLLKVMIEEITAGRVLVEIMGKRYALVLAGRQ